MSGSEKFWDKAAEKYADSPISDEASYQRKLSETQSQFTPDMRVLEFGCGTGTTAITHAPHVEHIQAIDISQNMLDIGRSRAAEAGVENITFTRSSLTDLAAQSESFDAVLGLNVLHLLPDRQAVLAEAARILKPGGIFVSSTVCLGHSYLRFIKYLVPLGRWLSLMPDVFVMTEDVLVEELQAAGFTIERQWSHGKTAISVFIVARRTC